MRITHLDQQLYSFQNWAPDLVYNNDSEANDHSYRDSQTFLHDKLVALHLDLQHINSDYFNNDDDVTFAHDQMMALIDYLFTTYEKSKNIKLLSVNLNNLIAKAITFNLSIMMKNGHSKFQIALIELSNKLIDCLIQNIKKLSMSKNWYSSLKHLSVIILKFIFTKFNGFLNNLKQTLCTALYKLTSKANDSYNSSIENDTFMSNYFSDMVHLLDTILTHDNSSITLDDKLFARLLKLFKFVTQKNNNSTSSSNYMYPLATINHAFSILVSLLKSDRYMTSLVSKKSSLTLTKYFASVREYINMIFTAMDTDHKKLKLGLAKQLSDLLIFAFVVFGSNRNDLDFALDSCIGILLDEYVKGKSTSNQKTAIIETLMQFISKLNLYYQTNRVKVNKSNDNMNFVSFKLFDILSIIYSKLFSFQTNELKKKIKPENSVILLDNSITINYAIKSMNHIDAIHKLLISEIDNDFNKLIVLAKIVLGNYNTEPQIKIPSLANITATKDYNIWYATTLLNFSQLLIDDLNEFILSDHGSLGASTSNSDITTQIVSKLSVLSSDTNFRLRVKAVETLIKLLKIKPELSFTIMNKALTSLNDTFAEKEDTSSVFNDTYSNAYLISSIISFVSKDFITSDFVLTIFTISLDFLKKFNTTVVSNNLFGSTQGVVISNVSYQKQLVSWMLLLGLFNYASTDTNIESNNFFLHDSNQFTVLWKNILAHTLPNGLIQIDKKSKTVSNIDEVLKLLEIKNQSLICMIGYINYLSLNKKIFTSTLISQLNQILSKSYTFIVSVADELNSLELPTSLTNSINANKLRIYEVYLKLLPHLNVKNEINSSMLIEIVKNFCDIDKYRYFVADPHGKFISSSNKKQQTKISEYLLYSIDDGVYYGLTSKFNNFKVDELMIKSAGRKLTRKLEGSDIDFATNHSQFLVESSNVQSNLSNVTVFDDATESRAFTYMNNSLLHDSFIFLYNNSIELGYTDINMYPVSTDIMSIDASIELFAIAFPHLSTKIQVSVLESIRSCIFYESKESITTGDSKKTSKEEDDEIIKSELSLMLRKKAVTVNSSIAIHSMLTYMTRYNSTHTDKIRLKKDVATLLVQTLKNISFEDIYLVYLNSESIGICTSVVDDIDTQEAMLHQEVTVLINAIAETHIPSERAFHIRTLAFLTKYSNMINTTRITNTIFALLMDPHPLVHSSSLHALDIFMNGKSNLEISENLARRILTNLQQIWLNDSFGIRSNTTISANINYREHSNSVNWMVKVVRSLINISGPTIRYWNDEMKSQINYLLFNFQYLITVDFEINIREVLKMYEELLVFDKSIISIENYKTLTKLLIVNNFRLGVYGDSLSNLPLDDQYDNENSVEVFPFTTSSRLLNMSLESAFQIFKIEDNQLIDEEFEKLLWIALEQNPENEVIKNVVVTLMEDYIEDDSDKRIMWFKKLLGYFNIKKPDLLQPLMNTFAKRINNGGMFFHVIDNVKSKTTTATGSSISSSRPSISPAERPDDLDEAEETLTSETPDSGSRYTKKNDKDREDDEDEGESSYRIQAISGSENSIQLLDLSNNQLNWKFKLFVIGLLNNLLSYCEIDDSLKAEIAKNIPEFIRISFISSTSNLISLRIASLQLLGKIIELYADTRDPLYPDVSILEQQQAQIISTITPSFDKGSSIELAGEAIILASKFISSNITNISHSGRILKLLTKSLEDLASSKSNRNDLMIGEIPILTNKAENKIKIYVLQAWSKLLILSASGKNSDPELKKLIGNYVKLLITLWVHTVREFSMMKYGSVKDIKFNKSNEGWSLELFENCWLDFVESICIVIDYPPYYDYLYGILGDDVGKLFMMIFGLCMEYTTKRTNKNNLKYDHNDVRIFTSLRKLFKLELSVKILFNDYIFAEFVDIVNKLIVLSSESGAVDVLMNATDLLKDIYIAYFEDLKLTNPESSDKSVDDVYSDFDKLFELVRLNLKIVTMKLTFIKDKEISNQEIKLEASDYLMIKKCFSNFIEMCGMLPNAIQNDLYANLMYMLVIIHEYKNVQLSTVLLPVFQRALSNYIALQTETGETNVFKLFKILNIKSPVSKEDQLLTFVIIKTVPDMILDDADVDLINDMILDGLVSKESNMISLSVQTVKSLIDQIANETNNSAMIIRKLIPMLVATLSDSEIQLKEPRLIAEIFISFIKKVSTLGDEEKLTSSFKLVIPLLIFFHSRFGYDSYIRDKLLELIKIDADIFKKVVQSSNEELKNSIQSLVNAGNDANSSVNSDTPAHIELKTFG